MYEAALPSLRCPTCGGELTLQHAVREPDGAILSGALICGCGRSLPIHDGVLDCLGPPNPATPAQRVNEWRATAWAYERVWRPFALTLLSREPFPYRRELPLIVNVVQPERGGLYLDLACSGGLYARALTRNLRGAAGHVIGIDHSMAFCQEARRRAKVAGLTISYVRGSAQQLPLAADSAAGIVIGGSLNEIGDLAGALRAAASALRPDGRYAAMALVSAPSAAGQFIQSALAPGGVVFWPLAELVAAHNAAGLPIQRARQYGIVAFLEHNKAVEG